MIGKIDKETALRIIKEIDSAAKKCPFAAYPYVYNIIKNKNGIEKDKAYDSKIIADDETIDEASLNIEEIFESITSEEALFVDAFGSGEILNVSDEDLNDGEYADYEILYLDGSKHTINTDNSDGILLSVEDFYGIAFVPKNDLYELYISIHSIDQGPGMWAKCVITEKGDTVQKLENVAKKILGL